MASVSLKNEKIVYSCSGCSSAAQLANQLALRMDREGLAQMSCIAGIGGKVAPLVALANNAEHIVAIDGCALSCCKACLQGIGLQPDQHIILSEFGVQKKMGQDVLPETVDIIYEKLRKQLNRS